jgi:NTP pyrophosphatase (non-canonical NTP hydrolase)
MELNEYQKQSRRTAVYPAIGHPVVYPTLGLSNEAGEVAGKIKKVFRDKGGEISVEDRAALKGELGDVLWYLAQVCTELDLTLEDVAEHNLEKLSSRLERGRIGGEGDDR